MENIFSISRIFINDVWMACNKTGNHLYALKLENVVVNTLMFMNKYNIDLN